MEQYEKGWVWFKREMGLILKQGRQVWQLVPRQAKWTLSGAALILALTSALNTGMAVFMGSLVDSVHHGLDQGWSTAVTFRHAGLFLGLIAGTFLLRVLFNVLRRYLVENTCTRIDRDMIVRLVGHLMKVDLSSLTDEKVGALNGRMHRSVDGFIRFIRLSLLDFLPAILTGVFALGTAIVFQPYVGLIMVGVIPTTTFLTIWQLTSQKNIRLKLIRSVEEMDGTVVEQLAGLDFVRAANTCEQEIQRVARVAEARRSKEIRHHFEMSLFGCAKALNEGLFHVLVLSSAVYLAIQGTIGYGQILTFSMLFLNVMTPLSEIHRILDEGHESSLRVFDLLQMLNKPVDRSFETVTIREPILNNGHPLVEVQDLRVEYVTEGRYKKALKGVSLDIRHGETIGLVGRTGAGKTTLLRVLLRLTHPSEGQVYIGGVPLEEISRESIGSLIGYVGQSPFIFSGTVEENIAYGVEHYRPEDVRRAAQMACIHEEILEMPGGYQGRVAERGQNLSGGQRQRLALARVFLKNPPILILDEGTSALDNISERNVQRAIEAARVERTVIIVAHRLTTVLDADRLFVFQDGRVVESGSYEELVELGGVFAQLAHCAQDGQAGKLELVS